MSMAICNVLVKMSSFSLWSIKFKELVSLLSVESFDIGFGWVYCSTDDLYGGKSLQFEWWFSETIQFFSLR